MSTKERPTLSCKHFKSEVMSEAGLAKIESKNHRIVVSRAQCLLLKVGNSKKNEHFDDLIEAGFGDQAENGKCPYAKSMNWKECKAFEQMVVR